ncbi:MAG TPA: YsnF/AvaK domain-containing protein [Gemmatirosa sp.]
MADNYNNSSLGNKASTAADRALGSHDGPSTTGDVVGETTGGLAGAATGAALGSLGGPLGTIIGGIAGAAGGWWTGRAVSEAASTFDNDDPYYRNQYASRAGSSSTSSAMSGSSASSSSSLDYDQARPAYQLGHVAGLNPDYEGRQFDDVEPHLRSGWEAQGNTGRNWNDVRDYARDAYSRGQERRLTLAEEQLAVGKRQVQAGEVNLRKTVETERVQQQVGLTRDEVTVERRPLTAADAGDLTIGEETIRVPLTREEAVVEKRIVPTEEVVVRTREVTDNQTVEADLRRERLVTEGLDQQTGYAAGTTGSLNTSSTSATGTTRSGEGLLDKAKDAARNLKDDVTGNNRV